MVSGVGGISVLDSLAAIARIGVRGGDPSAPERAAPGERTRRHDRVELSGSARAAADAHESEPAPAGSEAHEDESTEPAAATSTPRTPPAHATDAGAAPLSEAELEQVEELKTRDRTVRTHEQAHRGAAGALAGPISYSYSTGPDGRRYATEGSVPIDTTPIEGDPIATIRKMERVKQAALAPADPSSADRQIAARASQQAAQAHADQRSTGETSGAERAPEPGGVDDETDNAGEPNEATDEGRATPAATATKLDVYA